MTIDLNATIDEASAVLSNTMTELVVAAAGSAWAAKAYPTFGLHATLNVNGKPVEDLPVGVVFVTGADHVKALAEFYQKLDGNPLFDIQLNMTADTTSVAPETETEEVEALAATEALAEQEAEEMTEPEDATESEEPQSDDPEIKSPA
jgi:L-2-hydroxyglutarate oxidase LhgO